MALGENYKQFWEKVTEHLVKFLKDMPTFDIANAMREKGLLTDFENEKWQKKETTQEQNSYIIEVLKKKGPDAPAAFLEALKKHRPHLYKLLQGSEKSVSAFSSLGKLEESLPPTRPSKDLILAHAVNHYQRRDYTKCLECYKELIDTIVKELNDYKGEDTAKRESLIVEFERYTRKIGLIKKMQVTNYTEIISVAQGSTGLSYERLFAPFVDDEVTKVTIEDPYIRQPYQISNFVRFCEMLVKNAKGLKEIELITVQEQNQKKALEQTNALKELEESLRSNCIRSSIALKTNFSTNMHDRMIRFDSGWTFNLGKGLDVYDKVKDFAIGKHDEELKVCKVDTRIYASFKAPPGNGPN